MLLEYLSDFCLLFRGVRSGDEIEGELISISGDCGCQEFSPAACRESLKDPDNCDALKRKLH